MDVLFSSELLSSEFFSPELRQFLIFIGVLSALVVVFRVMYRLVMWGKKRPKGGYLMIALLPLISIFPIPAQEVKKIEAIKKEQLQEKDENGEPKDQPENS